MSDRSAALIGVGLAYLDAHKPVGFVAATSGGSVARGEADEYSDLDLNLYVDSLREDSSENREFAGEVLQLHTHPFPSMAAVQQAPWDNRFLREAGVVSDPSGRYEAFADLALTWLDSAAGLSAARKSAVADVCKRRMWAEEALDQADSVGAGMASVAAVTDAAMLYRFCRIGAVSTGTPVTSVCEFGELPEVDMPWKHIRLAEAEELSSGLASYRVHLAQSADPHDNFVLEAVQDRMTAGKAARSVGLGDRLRLGEMLYHETFWVLLTQGSRPFAKHLSSLPAGISSFLRRIGYDEAEPDVVRNRLSWAEELCARACRGA